MCNFKCMLLCMFLFNFMSLYSENKIFEVDQNAYQNLDQLALSLNTDPLKTTDKSSRWHNYTYVYSHYFDRIKEKNFKFLEIGIQYGYSAQLWENYFPNAELHFMDIDLNQVRYSSPRNHYHLANQENVEDLLRVANEVGGEFDLIIDDGGHTMAQQIISFITLFPFLKSGGIYVIEDLHTSYWNTLAGHYFGGGGTLQNPKSGPGTAIQFFKDLVDEINFPAARTFKANNVKNLPPYEVNIYRESILGIHFYESLCFIIKK